MSSEEELEFFVGRQMAELMVENWDRYEPIGPASFASSRSSSKPR